MTLIEKRVAIEVEVSAPKIYEEVQIQLITGTNGFVKCSQEDVALYLPIYASVRHTLARRRPKVEKQPKAVAELIIPPEYQETLSKENFMLFDTGSDDPLRMIALGSSVGLDILSRSDQWHWYV